MTRSVIEEESMRLIHAYLDGELDPANALAFATSIQNNPILAAECERIQTFRRVVRERLPREIAPPGLRARIEASTGLRRSSREFSWRALAASIAVTAIVVGSSTALVFKSAQTDTIRDAVVASHIRSLMAPQSIDVASSDSHTVKPWFNGKIAESPRVVDLARQDFPLLGGRLDVVGQAAVPTLVYRHDKHLISVTAMPAGTARGSVPQLAEVGGYNTAQWTDQGVTYWAVSDIEKTDLRKFAELFCDSPMTQ
jgi:anti-sigma factor RsiW